MLGGGRVFGNQRCCVVVPHIHTLAWTTARQDLQFDPLVQVGRTLFLTYDGLVVSLRALGAPGEVRYRGWCVV